MRKLERSKTIEPLGNLKLKTKIYFLVFCNDCIFFYNNNYTFYLKKEIAILRLYLLVDYMKYFSIHKL